MALVLYHVEDAAKEKQLSALCRELHLTARRLTNADRDRAVAALCGEKVNANVQKAPAGYKLPEVLIFSGFAGEMLDVFLAAYKKAGIAPIPLKAVHTEHNDKWSLYALCEELRREHAGNFRIHGVVPGRIHGRNAAGENRRRRAGRGRCGRGDFERFPAADMRVFDVPHLAGIKA